MDERSERIARRFDLPMLVAALLVVPVVALEESNVGDPWRSLAGALNWVIWIAFATEVVVMLAVVPSRRRWIRDHPLEVLIVLCSPPFLPSSLQTTRVLRLLRLTRLLRLASLTRRAFSLTGLRYAAVVAAVTILAGGAAYAAAEDLTTWDGVWWAINTMTTVGYTNGPHTDEGRIITIGVLAVGVGFVALLTGAVAERFLRGDVEEVVATDEDLLRELHEVRATLERVEARMQARS